MTGSSWRALFSFDDIRGESESLRHVVWLGRRAAEGGYPPLIVGACGPGKELLAHAIHAASPQRDGPFVAINCGTLSRDLAVAELCGYEAGAFTGADRQRRTGLLDAASGGTLFLDELQDMAPASQSVLLRFLETQSFVRVGGTRPVTVNVRVVATLNVTMDEVERAGLVRSDLLYRLNCLTIDIPPLRERRADIVPIAEKCLREELHFLGEVDDEFWTALATCPYSWPGNARGLRNVLLKAILASSRGRLAAADLPRGIWEAPAAAAGSPHVSLNGRAADDMVA